MSPIRALMWSTALLTLALTAPPARAIEEPPRPPMSALGKIRDLATTVRARRALQEDRVLSTLNLGVSVENGIASVWGPIPSAVVGRQAIAKLESVTGITRVRSNFYSRQPEEASLLADLPRPSDAPERIETAKPSIETDRMPIPVRPPEMARPVARQATIPRETPRLLAPRAVATSRTERSVEESKSSRKGTTLLHSVLEVKRADPRFDLVGVRVEHDSVYVLRGDVSGRTMMDLVEKLRRVPGVSDVILTDQ